VLPRLEREHEVLAPTLPGHAGGPVLGRAADESLLADAVEAAMDDAGFETAHVAGNSLGGWVALQLAARGRARSVVAFAPAGGWLDGDGSYRDVLELQRTVHAAAAASAAHTDAIAASPSGRRRATRLITVRHEHLAPELVAHLIRGSAGCSGFDALRERALRHGWPLDPERIACPVRIVWGAEDELLRWPRAAERYRRSLPHADWVVLDGVGHSPQLDVPLEAAELILGFAR
jgi:pimeloyl-ACP methyl ester carboxylesterase